MPGGKENPTVFYYFGYLNAIFIVSLIFYCFCVEMLNLILNVKCRILYHKLERSLKEFISGRKQCIRVDGELSNTAQILSRASQGNDQGPLILFTVDLGNNYNC